MLTHAARMGAITALLILCTLLPYLPGRYDALAAPLSVAARLAGMAGLLLVPIGAAWLAYELWSRRGGNGAPQSRPGRRRFAIAALVAGSAVCLVASLGALLFAGVSAGAGALALSAYGVVKLARRIQAPSSASLRSAVVVPLYLLLVPIAVAALQAALLGPAAELSRGRAIRNSGRLIADIERYRAERGHYPPSLLSVWEDYRPSVMGIERYLYEPSGEAYNLAFEQPSLQLDSREFVVYNPRDEQVMTSHNMDLLRFTAAELEVRRGHYATRATAHAHWKTFLFD